MVDIYFWQNKKVLITGDTGFKGSWLSLWLSSIGANVIGVAIEPPTEQNIFEQANVNKCINHIYANINNLNDLKEIFTQNNPEIVFHLAAQPLVKYSYDNPVETYQTNVMGTLNVLECIRNTDSVKSVVMVTTDKCYKNNEWEWGYRENEPMGGYDPYSSSKGCAELLIDSYRNSYFPTTKYSQHNTAIASVRAGNVIGGGDWALDRLIPDIIRGFHNKSVVKIRYPNAIRPWQHVLEPLYGYILLAQKLYIDSSNYAQAWNFGPNDADVKTVRWIVKILEQTLGINWVEDKTEQYYEANYLKLDCSKAKQRLQWYPNLTLNNSLNLVAKWHEEYDRGENMQEVTLSQINDYQKNIKYI